MRLIQEIVAPFHLALQDESAASAHDENLIREVRAVLNAGPLLPADVAESRLLLLIGELKTIAAKRRALGTLYYHPWKPCFNRTPPLFARSNSIHPNVYIHAFVHKSFLQTTKSKNLIFVDIFSKCPYTITLCPLS